MIGTDDPLIWQGHATLIHEIREQLPGSDKPDAVFCSVGGGGLLSGLMLGCEEVGWGDGKQEKLNLRSSVS